MKREAIFDETGTYRYSLTRKWSEENDRKVTFILAYPNHANEYKEDPAVRKCVELAKKWGFGSLEIVHLFSYQTDHISFLRTLTKQEAVGVNNDYYLLSAIEHVDLIIAAWGDYGSLYNRQDEIKQYIKNKPLYCLGITKQLFPKHILSVAASAELQRFASKRPIKNEGTLTYIEDINDSLIHEEPVEEIKPVEEEEPLTMIEEIVDMFR
ncbi:DUF1643 domain-containing protein [Priestia megaterium]|nr:DUF1643 domain-containing protein [Priestia megaterium]